MSMKQYGLTDRFQALSGMYPEWTVARIISQEKGLYHLVTEYGDLVATSVMAYAHGCIDAPNSGVLQEPQDYLDCLRHTVRLCATHLGNRWKSGCIRLFSLCQRDG